MWLATMIAGFAFEIVGLTLAAFGLWRTWKENAQGRPFFPPWVRRYVAWVWTKVLRQSLRVPQGRATINLSGAGELSAAGMAIQGLNDSMNVDQKIAVVQENAVRALRRLGELEHEIRGERRMRELAVRSLTDRVAGTEASLTAFTRGLHAEGVPLAVLGLAFATLGLLLQGLATVATWSY